MENSMSERNGDKSRFGRMRKQKLLRRKRSLSLLKQAKLKTGLAKEAEAKAQQTQHHKS